MQGLFHFHGVPGKGQKRGRVFRLLGPGGDSGQAAAEIDQIEGVLGQVKQKLFPGQAAVHQFRYKRMGHDGLKNRRDGPAGLRTPCLNHVLTS